MGVESPILARLHFPERPAGDPLALQQQPEPGLYPRWWSSSERSCPPVSFPSQTFSTGEEALAAAVRCYDDLSRLLWGLEGLPLTVSAVQGAHPVLRYTEVRRKGQGALSAS